jgi:plasmid stabilization system protein ParE
MRCLLERELPVCPSILERLDSDLEEAMLLVDADDPHGGTSRVEHTPAIALHQMSEPPHLERVVARGQRIVLVDVAAVAHDASMRLARRGRR